MGEDVSEVNEEVSKKVKEVSEMSKKVKEVNEVR